MLFHHYTATKHLQEMCVNGDALEDMHNRAMDRAGGGGVRGLTAPFDSVDRLLRED